MNGFRSVFVLALTIGFVAVGMNGTAWAAKLDAGDQSPAVNGHDQGLSVSVRPDWTVITTNPIIPITGDETIVVGRCATVLIVPTTTDVSYTASVAPSTFPAQGLPGNLMSCIIKIEATPGRYLNADIMVCFPVLPKKTSFAYYLDTKWEKARRETNNGNSCVDIPTTSGSLVFAALFDK